MSLRDPASIDIIHEPPPFETEPCKLVFVIVDAIGLDADTRYSMLIQKLTAYLQFITSPEFANDHPSILPEDVIIRFLALEPLTEAMNLIHAVKTPDQTHRVRVFFENYHQYMSKMRGGGSGKPSNN